MIKKLVMRTVLLAFMRFMLSDSSVAILLPYLSRIVIIIFKELDSLDHYDAFKYPNTWTIAGKAGHTLTHRMTTIPLLYLPVVAIVITAIYR